MKKTWVVVSFVAALPFVMSIVLNSGCGSSPTSASSATPAETMTPFVNGLGTPVNEMGTPCASSYGNYDTAGIGLTPLPQNNYVAVQFTSTGGDYPTYSEAASVGQVGIYASNSGAGPETIEVGAYGSESGVGGPLDGSAVSIQVPVTTGGWEVVSMPNISFTDSGPNVYLAAHAIGADLSIGAKGSGSQQGISGSQTNSISGFLPTPTVTTNSAANYEMFIKSCP